MIPPIQILQPVVRCIYCQTESEFVGLQNIHMANMSMNSALAGARQFNVYVCRTCGFTQFFTPLQHVKD